MIAASTRRRFVPEVVTATITWLAVAETAAAHAGPGHAHALNGLAGETGWSAFGLAIAAAAIGTVVWPRWRDGRRRERHRDPFTTPELASGRGGPVPYVVRRRR